MDPQATWDQFLCAYAAGDWDTIEERATDLLAWLDRGGFPPKVIRSADLDQDFDRALARAGCLHALETVRGEWRLRRRPDESKSKPDSFPNRYDTGQFFS